MRIEYVIKDYTDEDFSSVFTTDKVDHGFDWFLESVAEEIGERHFYEDPRRPEYFGITVGVRREGEDQSKWFKITAEPSIKICSEEIDT